MTDPGELSTEAARLIGGAERAGMVLRALGSVGVRLHCPPSVDEMDQRRRWPKDIDLITRKKDRRDLRSFFEAEGYEVDRNMLVAMEGTRYLFRNLDRGIDVDVWVDVLDLCHRLDLTQRMGPGPSLQIEDLILSKLQIVELTENDIQDLGSMLSTHDLGEDTADPEVIDVAYISRILCDDWGFWKTATDNLRRLLDQPSSESSAHITSILDTVDRAPKTLRWKLRAKIGERVQWWQEVDIPRDTY